MKKMYVFGILLLTLLFVVGCGEQASLDDLNDDELDQLTGESQAAALAGNAKATGKVATTSKKAKQVRSKIKPISCEDSDELAQGDVQWDNPDLRGIAAWTFSLRGQERTIEYQDECVADNELKEYFCTKTKRVDKRIYECDCQDGACAPEVVEVEEVVPEVVNLCGNGVRDEGEPCDTAAFPENRGTCQELGYQGGQLSCNNCQIDVSLCNQCGNGIIDEGEECDGGLGCRQDCTQASLEGIEADGPSEESQPLPIEIRGCMDLEQNNTTYMLTRDIILDGPNNSCFTVRGDLITLDCQDNLILARNLQDTAIAIYGSNATVQNCEIQGPFNRGIMGYYADNSRLHNNIVSSVNEAGIFIQGGSSSLENNIVNASGYGFYLRGVQQTNLNGNNLCTNGQDLYCRTSSTALGLRNTFGSVNECANNWPVLGEHYTACQ